MSTKNYIKVAQDETEEPVKVACEPDGTILLSTLASAFPDATGLKYLKSGKMHYLFVLNGRMEPVEGTSDGQVYYCCFDEPDQSFCWTKKRSRDESTEESFDRNRKVQRIDDSNEPKCTDLFIGNLSPQTTEVDLLEYFSEEIGDVSMASIKKPRADRPGPPFAFIRFIKYSDQVAAMARSPFKIHGQLCFLRPSRGPLKYRSPPRRGRRRRSPEPSPSPPPSPVPSSSSKAGRQRSISPSCRPQKIPVLCSSNTTAADNFDDFLYDSGVLGGQGLTGLTGGYPTVFANYQLQQQAAAYAAAWYASAAAMAYRGQLFPNQPFYGQYPEYYHLFYNPMIYSQASGNENEENNLSEAYYWQ